MQHFVDVDVAHSNLMNDSDGVNRRSRPLIEALPQGDDQMSANLHDDDCEAPHKDCSSLECVLRLLLEIIDTRSSNLLMKEDPQFVVMLPDLQRVALCRPNDDCISSLANEVVIKILLRSSPLPGDCDVIADEDNSLQAVLAEVRTKEYLLSESPSLRSLGVAMIARKVARSQKVTYLQRINQSIVVHLNSRRGFL